MNPGKYTFIPVFVGVSLKCFLKCAIYLLNNRNETISNERSVAKNRISTIHDLPTQKKLKTEQSPEISDEEKISCRPFQYLSMVKNKSPGTTVTIKGRFYILELFHTIRSV